MSRLESARTIEAKVGAPRHAAQHLGRAVSAEQRVYVLHSAECLARGIDLRSCEYSTALDQGIDLDIWADFQDQVVELAIDPENGDLLPLITSETPATPPTVALSHGFIGGAGHRDDDECTHREDGTDETYCGRLRSAHPWSVEP